MKTEYSVFIVWSQEDGAYIASVGELAGCVADGQTPEEALANARIVAQEWIDVAVIQGRDIPHPWTLEELEKQSAHHQKQLQEHIRKEVQSAVYRVLAQLSSLSVTQYSAFGRLGCGAEAELPFEFAGGSHRR